MNARRDRGVVLPLVLVIVVVLALVIIALANYTSGTLRYGQVVERSSDRLASANAAIDTVLESIDRRASLCTMSTLANGGHTFTLGVPVNGIDPSITCTSIGAPITGIEEYALILTDDGSTTDELIEFLDGGLGATEKVIDGPVYLGAVANSSSLKVNRPFTIANGDLWYKASSCPSAGAAIPSGLTITPATYGLRCVTQDWTALFGAAQPPEPDVANTTAFPLQSPMPPPATASGCHVWAPGRYEDPPMTSANSYHYFRSGDYFFDDIGQWAISDAHVLAGWPGPAGPAIAGYRTDDTLSSNPCATEWAADDPTGATFYMGDSSHIEIGTNGALEVAGRDHGGLRVSIQALSPTSAYSSDLVSNTPRIVRAFGSPERRLSLDGLLWAPLASTKIDGVSNSGTPALRGGAVLGEIHLGARPTSGNVLVRNDGFSDTPRQLEITASAVSPEGGTTRVEAVISYRDGEYALESRRVICLAAGDPAC